MAEREILRNYVTYLSDLMSTTSELTFKQIRITREAEKTISRFREASATVGFWKKVLKGRDPAEVGALFYAVSRIQEVFLGLANYSNLQSDKQNEVLSELKQLTTSLKDLKSTLTKG